MSRRQGTVSKEKEGRERRKTSFAVRLGIVIAALLVLGSFMAYLSVKSYLRGDSFRHLVSDKVEQLIRVDGELDPLQWKSQSVLSDQFEGEGNGLIHSMRARQLELTVDWGSIWSDTWQMSDFNLSSLDLELGAEREPVEEKVAQPSLGHSENKVAWYQKYLPERAELSDMNIGKLHLGYTQSDGLRHQLSDSRVSVEFHTNAISLDLEEGSMEFSNPWLQKGSLTSAKFNYRDNILYLHSLNARMYDDAVLKLSGEHSFITDRRFRYQGTLLGAECEDFLSEEWAQKLQGELAVKLLVEGSSGKSPEMSGELKIREGLLTALPVLDKIAAYADSSQFRRLRFSKFHCNYKYSDRALQLSDIYLHCDGLMRLEGRLSIQDRQLDGLFQLGVVPGVLSHIPGAETKVFTKGKDQLLWASMKIGGTIGALEEDLSNRMLIAAGMRMFEIVPETGAQVLKYTGETLESLSLPIEFTQLPNELLKAGSDVLGDKAGGILDSEAIQAPSSFIEAGAGLLGEGLGGLFGSSNSNSQGNREEKKAQDDE